MLIDLNIAADLTCVDPDTIYRYTYPTYTPKPKPARLSKVGEDDSWLVETTELKNVFPDFAHRIEFYERKVATETRRFLESKIKPAISNKDWAKVSALVTALEATNG